MECEQWKRNALLNMVPGQKRRADKNLAQLGGEGSKKRDSLHLVFCVWFLSALGAGIAF